MYGWSHENNHVEHARITVLLSLQCDSWASDCLIAKVDGPGWVDLPDPENPVGARGVGEPAQGSVSAALTAAISDALGGHIFGASPITADMIINHVAGTSEDSVPLAQNNFRG